MVGEIVAEPLPFTEAIEYFADKVPLTKTELAKLSAEAQARAFTVAVEQKMEVISGVKAAVQKALEEGTTLAEFIKDSNALFDALGVTRMNSYHAQVVFRNNIQTSYSVGRYRKMTDPDVLKERPYFEYDAVDDGATSDICLALNGKVYPANHPIWETFTPLNHHNCRSRLNSISSEEIEEEGLKVEEKVPVITPGTGFEQNPATSAGYKPDWSKYPEELRQQAGV